MKLDELRILIIAQFRTQQAFGLATRTDPTLVNKVVNGVRTIPSETAKRWEVALNLRSGELNKLVTEQGQSAWIFVGQQKKAN